MKMISKQLYLLCQNLTVSITHSETNFWHFPNSNLPIRLTGRKAAIRHPIEHFHLFSVQWTDNNCINQSNFVQEFYDCRLWVYWQRCANGIYFCKPQTTQVITSGKIIFLIWNASIFIIYIWVSAVLLPIIYYHNNGSRFSRPR